jgi:hypothetical protein
MDRLKQRLERLLDLIEQIGDNGSPSVPMRLCLVSSTAVGVDGAGVSLISGDSHRAIAASDKTAAEVEDLQTALGEGPCFDAVHECRPVIASDLAAEDIRRRWPQFSVHAMSAGVRSVFGFPLTVDGKPVGALDLYSSTRRSLSDDHIDDVLILADLTSIAVRDLSDRGWITEVGLSSGLDQPWAHRAVVHHATGMTAVHLDISVDEALLRLRAHAFATSRALDEVSRDVVDHRLTLEVWGPTDER